MIDTELHARIRRYFYAEHWRVGTIAAELDLHPDTIRRAIELDRPPPITQVRPSQLDPYMAFIRETLDQHPRLRATRLHLMIQDRGYKGSPVQVRRAIARLRPAQRGTFLHLDTMRGEQAQADWADFGKVTIAGTQRRLSCFVMTLSWSRALYLEFFLDQMMENFQLGHVRAFQFFQGQPRSVLYDNLKSAVLERRGKLVQFHPRLLDLCAHYHFEPKPCAVRAGNQKGRVERSIRYVRDSFWAGRAFTSLAECNRQAWEWRDRVAHLRPWPQDPARTVASAFDEERTVLIPSPANPFHTCRVVTVHSAKTIYVRFDLNDYSIPPQAVGRTLTLTATDTEVLILDGTVEVARHVRHWGRKQYVLDPAHQAEALMHKRKAIGGTPASRLAAAVPESQTLLDRAFTTGESTQQQTAELTKLLHLHGAPRLRRAVAEAIQRDTPRASSVAFLLHKHERETGPLPEVDLSRHPEFEAIQVQPHGLETYDDLARHDPETE